MRNQVSAQRKEHFLIDITRTENLAGSRYMGCASIVSVAKGNRLSVYEKTRKSVRMKLAF